MAVFYEVVRHNHIVGEERLSPWQFRNAAEQIADVILQYLLKKESFVPRKTVLLIPWRAGLAFSEAAKHCGFEHFYHLGARRNEETLETEIYFEEMPEICRNVLEANQKLRAVIADPMLATGNTVVTAIFRLQALGILEQNIRVVSVVSSPEGVDHVLSLFPKVRIIVGSHDECLDRKGYIEPGLGDFGDRYFVGVQPGTIACWKTLGILTDHSHNRLLKRMGKKASK